VFSEINWANKRMTALRLSYGVAESDRAPDTYAEFLLRSRISILHEPPARPGGRVTRSGNNARLAGTARLDGPARARDGQHLLLQRRAGPRDTH
jgi:hypothetical protein